VSIIPGILALAPDLTEIRRGFSELPNWKPVSFSTFDKESKTSFSKPDGNWELFL
jgi:hypothetical protein